MGIIEDPPIAFIEHVSPLHYLTPIADIDPQIAGLDADIEQEHFGLIRAKFYPKIASGEFGSRAQLLQIVEEAETSPHLALGLPLLFVSAPSFQQGTYTNPTLPQNESGRIPLGGTLMWAMLEGEYLSDAPTSILRHWRRLGNQGVVEYPMVPFGTVALAGTEVTFTQHTIYICILTTLFRLYISSDYGSIT